MARNTCRSPSIISATKRALAMLQASEDLLLCQIMRTAWQRKPARFLSGQPARSVRQRCSLRSNVSVASISFQAEDKEIFSPPLLGLSTFSPPISSLSKRGNRGRKCWGPCTRSHSLLAKNAFCHCNGRHCFRPASVERKVDHNLFQFCLCQSILLCSPKVTH